MHVTDSITASFYGDESSENVFTSEIDYDKGVITIVFPYNYPRTSENVLTMEDLKHVRVNANLDDNVIVSPALLYLDLTKENKITITNQKKENRTYTIIAEIRKSNQAKITSFELTSLGLNGIVDEENKTISLIYLGSIGEVTAGLSISHGATLSPDPRETALDFDKNVEITVIAQNGVDKSTYTIRKEVPGKVDFGIRPGSGKILWVKKLQAELGITQIHVTGGMAVTKDYVVLNTRNEASIYLDRKTGEKLGTMPNMASITGGLTNFYTTSDDDGNILICNLAPNAGTFKVWKFKDVNANPEVLIDWTESGSTAIGRKISIKGSLDSDAIITAAILGGEHKFARWQVTGGVLKSSTPEIVAISGIGSSWWNNSDVVATSATDLTADYFVSCYAEPRKPAWVDGSNNTVKTWGLAISPNWIQNAADYAIFNECPYVAHNSINSFTWGSDDKAYLADVSSTASFASPVWQCDAGKYGGKENGGQNANGTGDVQLKVSEDGYFMYLYFMFTNGAVVCVQFDCIDM